MHIDIRIVNSNRVFAIYLPMPVHVGYDRRTLVDKEADDFIDTKGHRQQSGRTVHRPEPVCCCERCYACLANPLIGKLYPDAECDWSSGDVFVADDDDAVIAPEWFPLCHYSACDCKRCIDVCRKLCRSGELSTEVIRDDSPPMNKKRMTANLPVETCQQCPMHVNSRRPLANLQHVGATTRRPDAYCATQNGWSLDSYAHLCDNTRSWVQPPPNRTICHIVDDVTLERLTSSSPVLTRCCLTSRKQATGRHFAKAKAKSQAMSR